MGALVKRESPISAQEKKFVGKCKCGRELWASAGQIIRTNKCRHK